MLPLTPARSCSRTSCGCSRPCRRPARRRLHGRHAGPHRHDEGEPSTGSSPTPSAAPTSLRPRAGRRSTAAAGTQHAPVDGRLVDTVAARRRRRRGRAAHRGLRPGRRHATARPSATSAAAPRPPAQLGDGRRAQPVPAGRRPRAARPTTRSSSTGRLADDGRPRGRRPRRRCSPAPSRGIRSSASPRSAARTTGPATDRAVHPTHGRSGCSAGDGTVDGIAVRGRRRRRPGAAGAAASTPRARRRRRGDHRHARSTEENGERSNEDVDVLRASS